MHFRDKPSTPRAPLSTELMSQDSSGGGLEPNLLRHNPNPAEQKGARDCAVAFQAWPRASTIPFPAARRVGTKEVPMVRVNIETKLMHR
jgi:hypothetical protein